MHNDLLDTVLVAGKKAGDGAGAGENEPKCPVDHKTRATWLNQARGGAAAAGAGTGTASAAQMGASASAVLPMISNSVAAVVPTSASFQQQQQQQHQQRQQQQQQNPEPSWWSLSSWHMPYFSSSPAAATATAKTPTTPTLSAISSPSSSRPPSHPMVVHAKPASPPHSAALDTTRAVSSIPRSSNPGPSQCPVGGSGPASASHGGSGSGSGDGAAAAAATATATANHEAETGASASGHWVYPSEKQFFDAIRRKGFDAASAADMRTVVPIHNAVNERAWAEILRWEEPYCGVPPPATPASSSVASASSSLSLSSLSSSSSSSNPPSSQQQPPPPLQPQTSLSVATATCRCPEGPRLHSFAGRSENMTPRARLNTLLGYTAPFDRHDWVVDRCGTRVEYVIDFYAGRSSDQGRGTGGGAGGGAGGQGHEGGGKKLNFYLDVRPKMNTWEGVKMRALRSVGLK